MSKLWLLLACISMPPVVFFTATGLPAVFRVDATGTGLVAADPAVTWPVTGVAAPASIWWADDPTGSVGHTTELWTLTGSSTEVDTPFCRDGGWGDLTSGNCLHARRFGGSNDYYLSNSNSVWSPASGDFSVCTVTRETASGSMFIASNREGATGEGWSIFSGATFVEMEIENHAATKIDVTWNTYVPQGKGWYLFCTAHDHDGNAVPYVNAVSDSAVGSPTGTIAPNNVASVGASVTGGADYTGDIVAVFFWTSLLDATDMLEFFNYWAGVRDSKVSTLDFDNAGPMYMWVDDALEMFTDEWPLVGGAMPPGATGAGSPATGLFSTSLMANKVSYSRDLDSWTDVGTPTPTATSTDLFRDGRQTDRITDNDAGAVEAVKSAGVNVTALSTADKIQVCVYAKDSSGTVLDLQVDESGVCGGSTINFAAKTITTSWTQYEWTHTLADGTCTTAEYKLAPTDWGVVANTGSAEFVIQVFLDQDWCPPNYIETASAAVNAGTTRAKYDISATSLNTAVAEGAVFSFNYTPFESSPTASHYLFELEDLSGHTTNYYSLYWHTDDKIYLDARSDASGFVVMYVSNATWTPTVGTTYAFELTVNAATTTLSIDGGSVAGTNANMASGADDLDLLCLGSFCSSAIEADGWIDSFEVVQ